MSVSAFPYGVMVAAKRLAVSPDTANISTGGSDATVVAGLELNLGGTEFSSNSAGSYVVGRGLWLDAGDSADVWVERILISGTLTVDPGTGRLQMNARRVYEKHDTSFGGGAATCTVQFDYYDAASGGSLLGTVTLIFTASKEMGG